MCVYEVTLCDLRHLVCVVCFHICSHEALAQHAALVFTKNFLAVINLSLALVFTSVCFMLPGVQHLATFKRLLFNNGLNSDPS